MKRPKGRGMVQLHVRLLGPVDATVSGTPRPVSGVRRKAVLAVLALSAGQIVSTDRLIDVVWGGRAGADMTNALQKHVSYLRTALGSRTAIVARPPGYLLDLGSEPTDVAMAQRLIQRAMSTDDMVRRASDLGAALALWRGEPLIDIRALSWLDEQAEHLTQLRFNAMQAWTDARLELGEHVQLLPALQELARQHPFDENIHRQLMLALYRCDRQTDALAVYRRLRQTLCEDLGVEPGIALRGLQAAILRHDPAIHPATPQESPITPAPSGSRAPNASLTRSGTLATGLVARRRTRIPKAFTRLCRLSRR